MGRFFALKAEGGSICRSKGLGRFFYWSSVQICYYSDYYPFKVKARKVSFAGCICGISFLANGVGGISLFANGVGGICLKVSLVGGISLVANGVGGSSSLANGVGGISSLAYGVGGISLVANGVGGSSSLANGVIAISPGPSVVGTISLVFKFDGNFFTAPGLSVARDDYKSHTRLSTTLIKLQKDLLPQTVLEDVACSVS